MSKDPFLSFTLWNILHLKPFILSVRFDPEFGDRGQCCCKLFLTNLYRSKWVESPAATNNLFTPCTLWSAFVPYCRITRENHPRTVSRVQTSTASPESLQPPLCYTSVQLEAVRCISICSINFHLPPPVLKVRCEGAERHALKFRMEIGDWKRRHRTNEWPSGRVIR